MSVFMRGAIFSTRHFQPLDDLHKRGMLEETLVVLATEFGRTPDYNVNDGRDHYPKAFSCMLAGGGIRGGQVWDLPMTKAVKSLMELPRYLTSMLPSPMHSDSPWTRLFTLLQVDRSPYPIKASLLLNCFSQF